MVTAAGAVNEMRLIKSGRTREWLHRMLTDAGCFDIVPSHDGTGETRIGIKYVGW